MKRITAIGLHFVTILCWARSPIEIKLKDRAVLDKCHLVRFPQGWKIPNVNSIGSPIFYDYWADYEFRALGVPETKVLVAGIVRKGAEWAEEYTTNKYELDLSDSKSPVISVDEAAWRGATVVPFSQNSILKSVGTVDPKRQVDFAGKRYSKTGEWWAEPGSYSTRLSPNQSWLALQSWTGSVDASAEYEFFNRFWKYHGKIFIDVYDTATGNKILAIQGRYSQYRPGSLLSKTGWITDRYFIVPIGEHREQCLVCDFGKKVQVEGARP